MFKWTNSTPICENPELLNEIGSHFNQIGVQLFSTKKFSEKNINFVCPTYLVFLEYKTVVPEIVSNCNWISFQTKQKSRSIK